MTAGLMHAFSEQIQSARTGPDGAAYFLTRGPDVRPIVQYLRAEHQARIVPLFAEDRRAEEGFFFNYYVLEQPGNPSYVVLQTPVSAVNPVFPSLSAELPALNWQEREIQDWFGIEASGHPNPRRVAL